MISIAQSSDLSWRPGINVRYKARASVPVRAAIGKTRAGSWSDPQFVYRQHHLTGTGTDFGTRGTTYNPMLLLWDRCRAVTHELWVSGFVSFNDLWFATDSEVIARSGWKFLGRFTDAIARDAAGLRRPRSEDQGRIDLLDMLTPELGADDALLLIDGGGTPDVGGIENLWDAVHGDNIYDSPTLWESHLSTYTAAMNASNNYNYPLLGRVKPEFRFLVAQPQMRPLVAIAAKPFAGPAWTVRFVVVISLIGGVEQVAYEPRVFDNTWSHPTLGFLGVHLQYMRLRYGVQPARIDFNKLIGETSPGVGLFDGPPGAEDIAPTPSAAPLAAQTCTNLQIRPERIGNQTLRMNVRIDRSAGEGTYMLSSQYEGVLAALESRLTIDQGRTTLVESDQLGGEDWPLTCASWMYTFGNPFP